MRKLPSEPEYIRERRLIREKIERDKRYFVYLCVVLAIAAVFLVALFINSSPLIENIKYKLNDIDCEILVPDFDYGDGIYFECEDETVLVDSGSSRHYEELIDFIKSNNIKNLNYLMITEVSEEYLQTLEDLLNYTDVSKIIVPGEADKSLVELYDNLIFSKGSLFLTSDKITYFTLGKMKFYIMDSQNLSLDICFGNHNFFVLNGEKLEHMNIKSKPDVLFLKNSDLLKNEILEMLNPKNCIVNSVLNDDLQISKKYSLFKTKTDGDIIVTSDEVTLKINTGKR